MNKYEQALTYSDSKVDFCYEIGVQMSPSDMVLKINPNTARFNLIRRADRQDGITFTLGRNPSINSQVVQPVDVPPTVPIPPQATPPQATSAAQHEEDKVTLIILGILLGSRELIMLTH